jgi:hypothetical protein
MAPPVVSRCRPTHTGAGTTQEMKMDNLARNRILWIVTTALTLIAAVLGVAVPGIYDKVVAAQFIPAGYAQDLLTILVCVALLIVIFLTRENDLVKQVVILGIMGSFFYLYGIYVIERVYNLAYYLYLVIFSLSFWSLLLSVASLKGDSVRRVAASTAIRHVSAWFSLLIALLFGILWTIALFPLLKEGRKIENLYSIYILDLCFVMPAFVIIGVMLLRKRGFGLILAPAMFILGIFVVFPLGLGELAKPFYDKAPDIPSMIMSFLLSAAFIVLSIVHLKSLRGMGAAAIRD